MKISVFNTPDGLEVEGIPQIVQQTTETKADVVLLPSMPFGSWLANNKKFDHDESVRSLKAHDQGIMALTQENTGTGATFVLSRPMYGGNRLFNTTVIAPPLGNVSQVHDKQVFPDEPGWYEAEHFVPGPQRHGRLLIEQWKVATLLCTETMFPELARAHGRAGANLILVPRSTGGDLDQWRTAVQMAASVSGAYCASANKTGGQFNGGGFVAAPDGKILVETGEGSPLITAELDLQASLKAKDNHPANLQGNPHPSPDDNWGSVSYLAMRNTTRAN